MADVTLEARSAPEPDLSATPEELVRRAAGLRELIRGQQEEAERIGHYTDEVHRALVGAGLYHVLTPKRYGGYEYDVPTFLKCVIEISQGDPASGWCYCLGHGHNLTTAGYWPEEAQDDVFRNSSGYFRASHSAVPSGTATPVEGGYVINATSPYQSGVPYATHATLNVALQPEGGAAPEGPPAIVCALVPTDECTVLDDWGGDATLGERASGSNTVVAEDLLIPASHVVAFDWIGRNFSKGSEGTRLHGNPMYLCPVAGYFHAELVATVVGAAKAALEEFEHIITTRKTMFPPIVLRYEDIDFQREFGLAMTMVDASEAILLHAADLYMQYCRDWAEHGTPFTTEMDMRLFGMIQRSGEMASDAVRLMFNAGGSAAAKRGQPLQRYYRDVAMYRGHNSAQYGKFAQIFAKVHFGMPAGF